MAPCTRTGRTIDSGPRSHRPGGALRGRHPPNEGISSMNTLSRRPHRTRAVLALAAAALIPALATLSAPASAVNDTTFEETASAFWSAPWECADGTIVDGTLLVETTRFFQSPETEDANPTARI